MSPTKSLAGRAEDALNQLAEAEAEKTGQQVRTEIEAARARASNAATDLRAVRDAVPDLAYCGVTIDLTVSGSPLQDVKRARTALRTAATSMVGAQPEEVASRVGTQSVDTALAIAERLARSELAGLNRSVERWRQKILPADIGERVVTYPGTSDVLVVRLEGFQRHLQQKVENLTAGQLAQRAQQIESDAASWAVERPRLDAGLEGRHPDVQEFLRRAATDEGAPWRLITPHVAEWLNNPENTTNLWVVLRS